MDENAHMTYAQLIDHFRGLTKAADALGVDRRHVFNWKKRRIPSKWQVQAEVVSDGKLRADKASRNEATQFAPYIKRAAA